MIKASNVLMPLKLSFRDYDTFGTQTFVVFVAIESLSLHDFKEYI